jgi:hypothetical protein
MTKEEHLVSAREARRGTASRTLYEKHVVDSVCHFLKRKGFSITQCLPTRAHGEDIKALAPDQRQQITIEAKGATSSDPTSKRFGKSFSSNQVQDHVAKAVYSAAKHVSSVRLTGVAFPKNDAHIEYVGRILPALKRLKIEVFWVSPDGGVEIARHWKIWKHV